VCLDIHCSNVLDSVVGTLYTIKRTAPPIDDGACAVGDCSSDDISKPNVISHCNVCKIIVEEKLTEQIAISHIGVTAQYPLQCMFLCFPKRTCARLVIGCRV